MMRLVASLILAALMAGTQVLAQVQGDANRFMEAVIDGLAIAADAHSMLSKSGSTIEQMMNTRLAVQKLEQAEATVSAFDNNKHAMTAQSATVFSTAYKLLARLLREYLTVFETLS